MASSKSDYPPYRWLILAIAWLSFFGLAMAWYIMPTLEYQIIEDYSITTAQYSRALTMPFLIAGILSIGGGMLADRLGLRRAASLGILIAGCGFLLRSSTASYQILLMAMFLVGTGLGLVMPNLPKLVSIWFPPEETGLATGIYNTGLMGGISTGLVIAPVLPGWSTGNLILGSIVIVLGILFFIIVRDSPPGKEITKIPLLEGIQTASKSKNSWFTAMAVFFGLAGMVSIQSSLPAALNSVYDIPMETGGRVASMITYAGVLGSLTLPTLAERSGKLKKNLILLILGFPIFMYLTWLIGGQISFILWGGTILAGYIAGGSLPIFMSVPVYLPDIKSDPVQPQHVGGASGMLSSLMNLGGFIGFPFIVTPIIISAGYSTGLLVACILFATQAVFAGLIDLPGNNNT